MALESVYVAGPFSSNPKENIDKALNAADELLNAGYYPFVPHILYATLDNICERSYTFWIQQCFFWLDRCDVVLRLPGESKGADAETALARLSGIPVVASVKELGAMKGGSLD